MDLAEAVREALPGLRTSEAAVDRAAAARDAWPRHLIRAPGLPPPEPEPLLVVWPEHAEQVQALVAFARQRGVGLVPYGAGSGVCGAVRPAQASIVVDTKRLTRLSVLPEEGVVDVEAGVLGVDLEATLERQGYTVGHFPSSILCSTVGGWLAARGAGQCSSRYGKIEDMVRSADCVLGSAEAVRLVRRTGAPNPLGLMIGSEGTLGIITSTRLRLHAAPAARAFAAYRMPSFEAGAEAMRQIMQAGLRPAVMRLYDPIDSYLLGRGKVERDGEPAQSSGMPSGFWLRGALAAPRAINLAIVGFERFLSASATLILIFEGQREQAQEDLLRAERLLRGLAGQSLGEAPARAWLAHRYAVSYRQSKVFQQGAFNDTLEVAAPWARLSSVYAAVRQAAGAHALVLAHLSHAYPDGCSIYFTLVGTRRGDSLARYDALIDAALGAALAEGATLSHHHGVGTSKAHFLDAELGGGLETLRRLRRAWDPDQLFNANTLEPLRSPQSPLGREALPGIDAHSDIATFRGETPLSEIEAAAGRSGLSLGLSGNVPPLTLEQFIAQGLPGMPDPFTDPVRGYVCGLVARGPVASFRLLPAPRRATGPDLTTLCLGAGGEIATVQEASLALVRTSAVGSAAPAPPAAAPVGAEGEAWRRIVAALATASALGLALLVSGCQPSAGAELPPRLDALVLTSVCPQENGKSVTVAWPALRWPGALFSASEVGGAYVATVKIGRTEHDCDHCPGPFVDATIAHQASARLPQPEDVGQASCLMGVGPLDRPLVQLKVTEVAGPASWAQHRVTDWQPRFQLDLDGRDGPELEEVARCSRVQPSGCSEHVCSETCTGMRSIGQPNDVRFVECHPFIPDVEDCIPQAPADVPAAIDFPPTACTLQTDRWRGLQPTDLRLSPTGPVFAQITAPAATAHLLANGLASSAGLEVQSAGLTLRGYVAGDAFGLRLTRATTLGGFAVPADRAELSWIKSGERDVSVSYDVGPEVEVVKAPLSASLPCDAVTLDVVRFEQVDAVGGSSTGKDALLRIAKPIALTTEPGGPVVARLRPKADDDVQVTIVDSKGGWRRILWWHPRALIFGWVAAADLRPNPKPTGYGTGSGSGLLALKWNEPVLEVLRCDTDVPVVAEAEGQRALVGRIAAGTRIAIVSRQRDYLTLQLKAPSIAPAPQARLLASAHDIALAGCVRQSQP